MLARELRRSIDEGIVQVPAANGNGAAVRPGSLPLDVWDDEREEVGAGNAIPASWDVEPNVWMVHPAG